MALVALTVPLDLITPIMSEMDEPAWVDVLLAVLILAYTTVGAFVAARRPGNPKGWISAALAFTSQLLHLWILPGEFAARPLVGALVFLVAVCEGLLAASLLLGTGRWAVRLGIVLNATIVFVWIVTRFCRFPAAVGFAWLPVEPLGLAATVAEVC